MTSILGLIETWVPSVAIGMILYFMQRSQKKRDEKVDKRAEARKEESALSMKLMSAVAQTAIAAAISIKEKKFNGELDAGLKACQEAESAYNAFKDKQAADAIHR